MVATDRTATQLDNPNNPELVQPITIALDFTLTYITKGGACRYDEEKADPDVQPKVGALYIREWAWKLQGIEPPRRVRVTVEPVNAYHELFQAIVHPQA